MKIFYLYLVYLNFMKAPLYDGLVTQRRIEAFVQLLNSAYGQCYNVVS